MVSNIESPLKKDMFDITDDIASFNCAYNSLQLNEPKCRLPKRVRIKNCTCQSTAASIFEDSRTIRRLVAKIFGGGSSGFAVDAK